MPTKPSESGFTLLELLIAIAIFSGIVVALSSILTSNQLLYARGQGSIEAQQNARIALETITRETRVAGRDLRNTIASLSPATAVQAANATSLTFVGDVNNDDILDKVTYRISGTQILRDFTSWNGTTFPAATTGILADGVAGLTFTYYDDSQPTNLVISAPVAAGSLPNIRRIQVGIVGTQSAAGGAAQTFSLVSDVQLRNL
jgi:type II secretion system protein J